MKIPNKLPGLKLLATLLAIYAAIWISLEGALGRVLVMGIGVTAVTAGFLIQRFLGGRTVSVIAWLGITAVTGLLTGLISVGITLIFMAVKTGLHAHGPEFTQAELSWVWQQLPLWGIVGLLGGTAVGLITIGISSQNHDNL